MFPVLGTAAPAWGTLLLLDPIARCPVTGGSLQMTLSSDVIRLLFLALLFMLQTLGWDRGEGEAGLHSHCFVAQLK